MYMELEHTSVGVEIQTGISSQVLHAPVHHAPAICYRGTVEIQLSTGR